MPYKEKNDSFADRLHDELMEVQPEEQTEEQKRSFSQFKDFVTLTYFEHGQNLRRG